MLRENFKCYGCYWIKQCDQFLQERCKNLNYELFTTPKDAELCNLMGCENVEKEERE